MNYEWQIMVLHSVNGRNYTMSCILYTYLNEESVFRNFWICYKWVRTSMN